MEWDDVSFVFQSAYMVDYIYWFTYVVSSLAWALLDHSGWSFLFVVVFGLQVFPWTFFFSWGKLVWNLSLLGLYMVKVSMWLWSHKKNWAMSLLFLFYGIIWGVSVLPVWKSSRIMYYNHLAMSLLLMLEEF